MKTFIALFALMTVSQAFAGPAVQYDCKGLDVISKKQIEFSVLFADHDMSVGYTNQSISINKVGNAIFRKSINFQMFGATKRNECKLNENGEINLRGVNFQDLGEAIKFSTNCGAGKTFKVLKSKCELAW